MYTHDIKFQLGDGSDYLNAELGVSDGKLIYKFTGTSQPIKNELIEDFLEFTEHVRLMSVKYGGVKNVSITKKE